MLRLIIGLVALDYLLNNNQNIGAIRIKSKFMPVYLQEPFLNFKGKTSFPWANGKTGVYIIKELGKIVYIGSSGYSVAKMAVRHFEPWQPTHPSGKQHYYKNDLSDYTIRIILTNTAKQAARLESALIHKYKPRDNYILENNIFEMDRKQIDKILEEYKYFEIEAPF